MKEAEATFYKSRVDLLDKELETLKKDNEI